MTFKGRTDTWWYVVIAILNGIDIGSAIYFGFSSSMVVSFIFLILLDLYFIPVIFKNEIVINKKAKEVEVKFGILRKTLPLQEITVIKEMKNYSASFAASFDRIGIESRRVSTIFISLQDKEAFINELLKANRKIRYVI